MSADSDNGCDDWRPTAAVDALRSRARFLRQLREHFESHGYWEVETPLMSRDICVDAAIDPFAIDGVPRMFLQTSPEFALKRLLVDGANAVFEITKSFRQGEVGRLHNPEFTIVEWYRVQATYFEQMDFVEQLIRTLIETRSLSAAGVGDIEPRNVCFHRITFDNAFLRFVGISALTSSSAELRQRALELNVIIPASLAGDDRDGWLNLLLAEVVEGALAKLGGVFLHDYPESQSAIARVRSSNPPVAERFELYLDGIEICNGYQELTAPDELQRRMEVRNSQRVQQGLASLPTAGRLVSAMGQSRLPECSGVALGFDRLVMWLLGKSRISDVMSFSWDRA